MSVAYRKGSLDLIYGLIFLYFFTLHADQLSVRLGEITVRLNNLLAFFLVIILAVHFRKQLLVINKWFLYALLMIGLAMLLSFLNSPFKKRCILFLGWYVCTMFFYAFLPYFLITRLQEEKIFKIYLASFLFVGMHALLQMLISFMKYTDPYVLQYIGLNIARPNAMAYEPSFYALYMTPFVSMVNFHFLTEKERPFFLFSSLTLKHVLFVNLLFLISTSTATFFVYCFFLFAYFLLLTSRHFSQHRIRFVKFLLGCILIGVLLALLVPSLVNNFYMKFFSHGFLSHHSFFFRLVGIKNAWSVFLEHPFLGVGVGGMPPYQLDAWLRGDLGYYFISEINEALLKISPSEFTKIFEPTNVFTEILGSLGFFGMGAFFFLFILFYKLAKKSFKHSPSLVTNLALSVIIMLVTLQFNQGLFRTYIWTHFAMTFAFMEKIAIR